MANKWMTSGQKDKSATIKDPNKIHRRNMSSIDSQNAKKKLEEKNKHLYMFKNMKVAEVVASVKDRNVDMSNITNQLDYLRSMKSLDIVIDRK